MVAFSTNAPFQIILMHCISIVGITGLCGGVLLSDLAIFLGERCRHRRVNDLELLELGWRLLLEHHLTLLIDVPILLQLLNQLLVLLYVSQVCLVLGHLRPQVVILLLDVSVSCCSDCFWFHK